MWPHLLKYSYVKTTRRYKIDLKHLRPYDRSGPDFALSMNSYRELITYCHYQPPATPELELEPEPEPQSTQPDPIHAALPPSPGIPSPPADITAPPAVINSVRSRVAVPSGTVLVSHHSYGTISAPARSMLEATCCADGDLCISRRVWQPCACKQRDLASNSAPQEAGSGIPCAALWVVIVTMVFCAAAYV